MTELERQLEKTMEFLGFKLDNVYKDRVRLYNIFREDKTEITAMVCQDHVNITVFEPTNADAVLNVSVDGEDLPKKVGCILAVLKLNY
jgi:hypothetical protein